MLGIMLLSLLYTAMEQAIKILTPPWFLALGHTSTSISGGGGASRADHTLQLPPELISEVAKYALGPRTERTWQDRRLLWLSHVCRRWRQIVHEDPALWSIVTIHFVHSYTLPKLRFWLEKSGRLPLDVALRIPERKLTQNQAAAAVRDRAEIVGLVFSQARRWRRAILFLSDSDLTRELVGQLRPGMFRELVEIESRFFSAAQDRRDIETELWDVICDPLHTKLTHPGWNTNALLHIPPNMPWGQLTTVDLQKVITPSQFLTIIPQCVALRFLKVGQFRRETGSVPESARLNPPAQLTRLVYLDVRGSWVDDRIDVSDIFSFIRTPSLRHMILDVKDLPGGSPHHVSPCLGTLTMLAHSQPRLTGFDIRIGYRRSFRPFIGYFRLPSLRTVRELAIDELTSDGLEFLTWSVLYWDSGIEHAPHVGQDDPNLFVPELRQLTVNRVHSLDGELAQMVGSRIALLRRNSPPSSEPLFCLIFSMTSEYEASHPMDVHSLKEAVWDGSLIHVKHSVVKILSANIDTGR